MTTATQTKRIYPGAYDVTRGNHTVRVQRVDGRGWLILELDDDGYPDSLRTSDFYATKRDAIADIV